MWRKPGRLTAGIWGRLQPLTCPSAAGGDGSPRSPRGDTKRLRKRSPTIVMVKGTTGVSCSESKCGFVTCSSYAFKSQFILCRLLSAWAVRVLWVSLRARCTVVLCLLNSTDAVECLGLRVCPLIPKCGCPQCGSQHWQG